MNRTGKSAAYVMQFARIRKNVRKYMKNALKMEGKKDTMMVL